MDEHPRDDQPERAEAAPRRGWWQRLTGSNVPLAAPQSALAAAAAERGWPITSGDPELAAVLTGSPLRLTGDYRAGVVAHGWVHNWRLVAFDVVYDLPKDVSTGPLYAVTALPVPIELPTVRVAPRRFLTKGGGGLLVLPSSDPAFDARWRVLAAVDTPEVRGLVGAQLRTALLDSPDLDEVWTAGGYLAVSRVGGQHGALLDEHAALLAATMSGLQRAL